MGANRYFSAKLMLQTAPVLLFFPPTIGPNAKVDASPIQYDFNRYGFPIKTILSYTDRWESPLSADQIHSWIGRHLPESHKPPIVRPVNYSRIFVMTTLFLSVITLFSASSAYILPVLQNRNVWAGISLIAILLFTSGHMFNHIRRAPYVAGDGKGGISYFAAGFQTQFGLETQIIAAICAYPLLYSSLRSNYSGILG